MSRGWGEAARALGGEEKLVSGGVLMELLLEFILNIYESDVCVLKYSCKFLQRLK